MIRYLSVAALVAVGATVAYAQALTGAAAIKERQALMKEQGTAMYRTGGPMIKGDKPFDLAVATGIFKTVVETSGKMKPLWPDDTQAGETRALPSIWTNKKDFNDWIDQTAKDAAEVVSTVKDPATFKAAYDKVNESCNGCHKDYRKPPEKKS